MTSQSTTPRVILLSNDSVEQLSGTLLSRKKRQTDTTQIVHTRILLSEKKPDSKGCYCLIPFIGLSGRGKTTGQGSRSWLLVLEVGVSWPQMGTRELLWILRTVVVTQLSVFVRLYRPGHFEQVLHKRKHTEGQLTCGKLLNIIPCEGGVASSR